MRALVISKNTLEIAKFQLMKPSVTIGRSPICDVVLRAPGIRPVHFMAEWIGSGKFDPESGMWTILDLANANDEEESQGVVLGEDPVTFVGMVFKTTEHKFDSKEQIGGMIHANLEDAYVPQTEALLELIQMREDSGAVENILHLTNPRWRFKKSSVPFKKFPFLGLSWEAGSDHPMLQLDRMPKAIMLNRGQKLVPSNTIAVRPADVLQIRWNGHEVFARFVEKVVPPKVKVASADPLLWKLSLMGAVLALIVLYLGFFAPKPIEEIKEQPQRVATIEIKEAAAPEPIKPPPPPPPKKAELPKEEPVKAAEKLKAAPKELQQVQNKNPGKAAAPKFEQKGTPKMGLNSPAKQTDINAIGILGALSKAPKKGAGVRADMIINDGIVTQSVSSENEKTGIVVRNSPGGVLGPGKTGAKGTSNELGSASTTLSGTGKINLGSTGPIAIKGGKGGYSLGTSLSGNGSGVSGGAGMGTIDNGGFSVAGGGLDRETVKRIIDSYKGQIRTCYERALLASPSLSGRISYEWIIKPQGSVQSVKVVNSTIQGSLQSCVMEVIQGMAFPASQNGRPTKVIYPFAFQGKN